MLRKGWFVLFLSLQCALAYEASKSITPRLGSIWKIIYESEAEASLHSYGSCHNDQFRCKNGGCISRKLHCNGRKDCRDNSDETYCSYSAVASYGCPQHYSFFRCEDKSKCIPMVWKCDGVVDCSDKSDEKDCRVEKITGLGSARQNAAHWLRNQRRNVTGNSRWGNRAPRIAVALYLADPKHFNGSNTTGNELAYEIENQVLVGMLKSRSSQISVNKLALYVHALLVACLNPRDFHGVDLVAKLRRQVNKQDNYTSPLVLLALCNAKENMTKKDVNKLISTFKKEERPVWTGTQALALMALSCISNQRPDPIFDPLTLVSMSSVLKKLQNNNGSFGNLQTTALVMQALFAAKQEKSGWEMDDALTFLVENQGADGSYGNFLNTYFTLPVLHYKSLLNISSEHCKNRSHDGVIDILDDLHNKIGKTMMVKYSLWFEDEVDLVRSIQIRVLKNSTFFDIMNMAKSVDEKYDFKYNMLNSKPFIYSLGEYEDDPENEKFWFLYRANATGSVDELIKSSPIDVIPQNKEEYIMWYRSGHWSQDLQTILAGATKE